MSISPISNEIMKSEIVECILDNLKNNKIKTSQFKILIPDDLRNKLDVAACVNKTSASQEAIRIINDYFKEYKDDNNFKFDGNKHFPEGMHPSSINNELRSCFTKVFSLISELSEKVRRLETTSL